MSAEDRKAALEVAMEHGQVAAVKSFDLRREAAETLNRVCPDVPPTAPDEWGVFADGLIAAYVVPPFQFTAWRPWPGAALRLGVSLTGDHSAVPVSNLAEFEAWFSAVRDGAPAFPPPNPN